MAEGLKVHAGLSGSGKSHAIKVESFAFARTAKLIIGDRMRECHGVPEGLRPIGGYDASILDEHDPSTWDVAVIRPPAIGSGNEMLEAVAKWAQSYPGEVGIALPEAHRFFDKKFDPEKWPATSNIISEWRHHGITLWADTQRFAMLNTDVVELARTMRLFAMNGINDKKALRAIGDKALVAGVEECAYKLEIGEPGWHIAVGVSRRGPFVPVRL